MNPVKKYILYIKHKYKNKLIKIAITNKSTKFCHCLSKSLSEIDNILSKKKKK